MATYTEVGADIAPQTSLMFDSHHCRSNGEDDVTLSTPFTEIKQKTRTLEFFISGQDRVLMAPYNHLDQHSGKGLRAKMILALNYWYKAPLEKAETIATVIGMFHSASLLVDDVEDDSPLRRGFAAAHTVYGTAHTINTANYVYFRALQHLSTLSSASATSVCIDELLKLHRGQGMEIYWRDSLHCPSEDEYVDMVTDKTAGLFRMAARLLEGEGSTDVNCIPLVDAIGVLFQIVDDYRNLTSYMTDKKGSCDDLREGKFSFPILAAINMDVHNPLLLSILRQKSQNQALHASALDYIKDVGAMEYTRHVIQTWRTRCLDLVAAMRSQSGSQHHEGFDQIESMIDSISSLGEA